MGRDKIRKNAEKQWIDFLNNKSHEIKWTPPESFPTFTQEEAYIDFLDIVVDYVLRKKFTPTEACDFIEKIFSNIVITILFQPKQ